MVDVISDRSVVSISNKTDKHRPLCFVAVRDLLERMGDSQSSSRSLSELDTLSGTLIFQLVSGCLRSALDRLESTLACNLVVTRFAITPTVATDLDLCMDVFDQDEDESEDEICTSPVSSPSVPLERKQECATVSQSKPLHIHIQEDKIQGETIVTEQQSDPDRERSEVKLDQQDNNLQSVQTGFDSNQHLTDESLLSPQAQNALEIHNIIDYLGNGSQQLTEQLDLNQQERKALEGSENLSQQLIEQLELDPQGPDLLEGLGDSSQHSDNTPALAGPPTQSETGSCRLPVVPPVKDVITDPTPQRALQAPLASTTESTSQRLTFQLIDACREVIVETTHETDKTSLAHVFPDETSLSVPSEIDRPVVNPRKLSPKAVEKKANCQDEPKHEKPKVNEKSKSSSSEVVPTKEVSPKTVNKKAKQQEVTNSGKRRFDGKAKGSGNAAVSTTDVSPQTVNKKAREGGKSGKPKGKNSDNAVDSTTDVIPSPKPAIKMSKVQEDTMSAKGTVVGKVKGPGNVSSAKLEQMRKFFSKCTEVNVAANATATLSEGCFSSEEFGKAGNETCSNAEKIIPNARPSTSVDFAMSTGSGTAEPHLPDTDQTTPRRSARQQLNNSRMELLNLQKETIAKDHFSCYKSKEPETPAKGKKASPVKSKEQKLPAKGKTSKGIKASEHLEKKKPEENKFAVECPTCKKGLPSKIHLGFHIRKVHMRSKPHMCQVCHREIKTTKSYQYHYRLHSDIRPFACEFCPKRFCSRSNLTRHTKLHTEKGKHVCELCGLVLSRADCLKEHITALHLEKKLTKCDFCGKMVWDLKKHSKLHTRDFNPCSVCGKILKSVYKLHKHMELRHISPKPQMCASPRKKYKYVCQICGASVGKLKEHLRLHSGEKPFLCDLCGGSFRRKHEFRDHMRTHSGERPHACFLCDARFARKYRLKCHLASKHNCEGDEDMFDGSVLVIDEMS